MHKVYLFANFVPLPKTKRFRYMLKNSFESYQAVLAQEQQLVFELETAEDVDGEIFLVGNFNNWKAGLEDYRLNKIEPKRYFISLNCNLFTQDIEYKYVIGNWPQEELDERGYPVFNRKTTRESKHIQDYVPRWRKNSLMYNASFLPEKVVISEDFEIPQLIKTRRITALLPHNYNHTDKKYPVLYLQDGQNLFDDYAPFGNWGIDKKLALMAEQDKGELIIIAIDHAEEERVAEFTPSHNTKLGKGEGEKYVRFLSETLKPFVDQNFRTKSERLNTGIGGSSMGGLISIYAGLMYPEIFSRIMLFSPSLWVDPNIYFNLATFLEPENMKIYLYGGGQEGSNMIRNIEWFKNTLEGKGMKNEINFKVSIDPEGKHNEVRWGQEFPQAVEWLFYN